MSPSVRQQHCTLCYLISEIGCASKSTHTSTERECVKSILNIFRCFEIVVNGDTLPWHCPQSTVMITMVMTVIIIGMNRSWEKMVIFSNQNKCHFEAISKNHQCKYSLTFSLLEWFAFSRSPTLLQFGVSGSVVARRMKIHA